MKAMLGFLEKLTLTPALVTSVDIEPLRAAGLKNQAIEDAIYVCFLFNVVDRLADAFDFPIPSDVGRGLTWGTYALYRIGYKGSLLG